VVVGEDAGGGALAFMATPLTEFAIWTKVISQATT